ncbi:SRPBCC domain-containing protein [Mucilaginibacter terrigena]|uniref:SRPBCC domain-containing protein n=1 Tax=Mucilaginibacter terrigena TaxID=2492395 RepID=A0A4Q5LMZ5_9SPHI|nr:SRPBCC domain-containing protein [Mucilaginibacter terrigena]RYU90535.1 SRPBCC domain-containing protein [Mucilaginibacter terrigena]
MKNQDFTTTILVSAAAQKVFDAINNVRGWWSENIEGDTGKLNSEFIYHYQDIHRAKMKITELVTNKKVVWHVVDNYFKFTKDENEWKGTNVIFEITEKDDKTQLTFTHQGLVPTYECYNVCHDAWTHYIQDSLKDLILTGKGSATPKEADENAETKPVPAKDRGTQCIFHRLQINAPVEKVYEAITTQKGLASWWTADTIAKPEAGSIARFAFGSTYFKEMKIEQLKPYSTVKWLCIKAHEEWIGTAITFELEPNHKGCSLSFHHDGWKAATNEFAGCSFDWALFLRSLKFLCETGKGFPYPEFNK